MNAQPKRNLKLEIEYDGSNYYGWQVQNGLRAGVSYPASKTIQHALEKVLKQLLQENIKLTVAGRTDSGVHALAQVANFKSRSKMPLKRMQWGLNGLLPRDIVVTKIKEVEPEFNSRFCAKSKIYRYKILNRRYSSALSRGQSYFFHHPLDVPLMRKEAKFLLGKHNFKSFQAVDSRQRNPVKTIKALSIKRVKDFVYIDIEADSFVYNMVRNIVGTLLEIGRGKFAPGSMRRILDARNRSLAGPTAPAAGLCLLKVRYK